MKMVCNECGSNDIYRKRIAYFKDGVWTDEPFADEYHCSDCGNEALEPTEED